MPLHHYSGYDCASAHSRPGTYADVYWIKEEKYEAFDDYAATIDTNEARAAIARFEGGGLGRSPPRYNCTACPLVSLKCDLNVQCLLTSLRLANLLTLLPSLRTRRGASRTARAYTSTAVTYAPRERSPTTATGQQFARPVRRDRTREAVVPPPARGAQPVGS